MSEANLKLLKVLKEDMTASAKRARKLLLEYGDKAYGENVDMNSEEAQDADVIHDALCLYLDHNSEQLFHLECKIAKEEKKVENSNILFRPHRGSLADAMAEIKEFKSEKELKEYIAAKDGIKPEDVKITLYSDSGDDRIAWPKSYLVEGHYIAGFLTYGVSLDDSLKAYKKFSEVFK